MSSSPFSRHSRWNGSNSNGISRPVGIDDQLPLEIDLGGGAAVDRVDQRAQLGGRQHDRDEADLEAVRGEDVAERRRDHDLEAVVLERPGRVLAGRAATEVRTRDQDLRPRAVRVVQLEFRPRPTGLVEAPVEEEELTEAGALDPLQKLLGDDLIGVDVRCGRGRRPDC